MNKDQAVQLSTYLNKHTAPQTDGGCFGILFKPNPTPGIKWTVHQQSDGSYAVAFSNPDLHHESYNSYVEAQIASLKANGITTASSTREEKTIEHTRCLSLEQPAGISVPQYLIKAAHDDTGLIDFLRTNINFTA